MTEVTIANRTVTSVSALSIPICWIFNILFLLFHLLSVFFLNSTCHAHLLLFSEHL